MSRVAHLACFLCGALPSSSLVRCVARTSSSRLKPLSFSIVAVAIRITPRSPLPNLEAAPHSTARSPQGLPRCSIIHPASFSGRQTIPRPTPSLRPSHHGEHLPPHLRLAPASVLVCSPLLPSALCRLLQLPPCAPFDRSPSKFVDCKSKTTLHDA